MPSLCPGHSAPCAQIEKQAAQKQAPLTAVLTPGTPVPPSHMPLALNGHLNQSDILNLLSLRFRKDTKFQYFIELYSIGVNDMQLHPGKLKRVQQTNKL